MRRIAWKVFAGCSIVATVITLWVGALALLCFVGYGHFPWLESRGLRPFIMTPLPYRWPNEVWESPGLLGFHRGVFFIGGIKAGKGNFLERYRYVIIPYWFCVGVALLAAAGAAAMVANRLRMWRARRAVG